MANIAKTAQVDRKARLGARVEIGDFTVVHGNVELGDDVRIGAHCVIGERAAEGSHERLVLGASSIIRSHSVFYEGSRFGAGLRTGHHTIAREKIVAGLGFQLGSFGELQGDTTIGDYTRLQANVTVGQRSRIGNYVWLFPFVVLTADPHPPSEVHVAPTLEDFAVVAAHVCILPGVTLGRGSLVAAGSVVGIDVPPETLAMGVPARLAGPVSKIMRRDAPEQPAYPWRHHFHRGYPEDVVRAWREEK